MQLAYRFSFIVLMLANFFIKKHDFECINILDKSYLTFRVLLTVFRMNVYLL